MYLCRRLAEASAREEEIRAAQAEINEARAQLTARAAEVCQACPPCRTVCQFLFQLQSVQRMWHLFNERGMKVCPTPLLGPHLHGLLDCLPFHIHGPCLACRWHTNWHVSASHCHMLSPCLTHLRMAQVEAHAGLIARAEQESARLTEERQAVAARSAQLDAQVGHIARRGGGGWEKGFH